MKVTTDNYIELSGRTCNLDFKSIRKRMDLVNPDEIMQDAMDIGEKVDMLKKAVFYGKGLDASENEREYDVDEEQSKMINIIHGVMGVHSESAELIQAIVLEKNEEIDAVNIIEEVGDTMWYLARILESVGATFEDAMTANIKKLAKRYPDGFKEEDAIIRDLEAEREILESQSRGV